MLSLILKQKVMWSFAFGVQRTQIITKLPKANLEKALDCRRAEAPTKKKFKKLSQKLAHIYISI